ncbi:replication initiation protein [Escherichia coli]|uniref:replication initiation protein n=1 Tax=Escherichia coli TaxID=562 RepID=UPI003CC83185
MAVFEIPTIQPAKVLPNSNLLCLWVTTHAWLNDRFVLPESQQKNLAELKRSFLDPALKQINEKTPLLAKYSIDDSGNSLVLTI